MNQEKEDITPATTADINRLEKKLDSKIGKLRKESQGDLEIWGGNLAFQIEESRQENNKRMDKQDKVLASLLSITQMLVGQLAEVKDTPEKVENHEQRITNLEVQARMIRR